MGTPKVGEGIGQQVALHRHRRDWTQKDLAERIREHDPDSKIGRGAVAKIENGERKVSVDEWLLLAAALNVPPPLLLLPLGSEDRVEITPRSRIHPHLALPWVTGDAPLAATNRRQIGGAEWHAGALPLYLYSQLRHRQEGLQVARQELDRAEYVGDDGQLQAARKAHAKALAELHGQLLTMQRTAVRPPRQTPEMLAEMEAVGLDVEGLHVWEPDDEEGE